jgi:hypothetical protein
MGAVTPGQAAFIARNMALAPDGGGPDWLASLEHLWDGMIPESQDAEEAGAQAAIDAATEGTLRACGYTLADVGRFLEAEAAAQEPQPAPEAIEARKALAADVHELIDEYCPDIPMCPKCERRKGELLDLADDYAAAAAPATGDAEDNVRLRAQVDGLRARLRAVRQLAELGAASGIIDSRALLGLLEAS